MSWLQLNEIAARRGDGLRPELATLLASRTRSGAENVESLAGFAGRFEQAGPYPAGTIDTPLPDGILTFPGRTMTPVGIEDRTCISR